MYAHSGELEHVHTSYVAKRPLNRTQLHPLFIFFTVHVNKYTFCFVLIRTGRHIGITWRLHVRARNPDSAFNPQKEPWERPREQPSERTPWVTISFVSKRYGPRSFSWRAWKREGEWNRAVKRERIKRTLGENASEWQSYKRGWQESHQERSDTSFVTLALDEDLFGRDVWNDGRRERFCPTSAAGAVNVISKCRGNRSLSL